MGLATTRHQQRLCPWSKFLHQSSSCSKMTRKKANPHYPWSWRNYQILTSAGGVAETTFFFSAIRLLHAWMSPYVKSTIISVYTSFTLSSGAYNVTSWWDQPVSVKGVPSSCFSTCPIITGPIINKTYLVTWAFEAAWLVPVPGSVGSVWPLAKTRYNLLASLQINAYVNVNKTEMFWLETEYVIFILGSSSHFLLNGNHGRIQ